LLKAFRDVYIAEIVTSYARVSKYLRASQEVTLLLFEFLFQTG
jgi:hypothetical protein